MNVAAVAREALELMVHKRTGDLTRAVGTEVGKDNRVVVADGRALGHDDRNHELVGHARVIGSLHCFVRGGRMLADALGNGVIGLLDALPAVVAVHRVIAAGNRGDAADLDRVDLRLQAVDIFDTGLRGRVAAVHEAVEAHLAQTVAARQLEQREHMVDMRVYAAIGQQAENMQGGVKPLALVDRAHERLVGEKVAVLDGLGDAGQLLIDDTARADVGVADLGVAHLPVRQTDIQAGGADIRHRVFRKDLVQVGGVRGLDRVAALFVAVAEPIHDDQRGRFFRAGGFLCRRFAGRGLLSRRLFCRGLLLRSGCGRLCGGLFRGRLSHRRLFRCGLFRDRRRFRSLLGGGNFFFHS